MHNRIQIENRLKLPAIELGYGDWIIRGDQICEVQSADIETDTRQVKLVTRAYGGSAYSEHTDHVSRYAEYQTVDLKLTD